MEANTELVKLRHKQFFQNFICDCAEQALVPDDVAIRPVTAASSTKRAQGSGVSMKSNSSVKNAESNEKEVKASQMLKIDQVLGPRRTTCHLGGGRLLHTIVPGSLYDVEDLEPSSQHKVVDQGSRFIQGSIIDMHQSSGLLLVDSGRSLQLVNFEDLTRSQVLFKLEEPKPATTGQQPKIRRPSTAQSAPPIKGSKILAAKICRQNRFIFIVDDQGFLYLEAISKCEPDIKKGKTAASHLQIPMKNRNVKQLLWNWNSSKILLLTTNHALFGLDIKQGKIIQSKAISEIKLEAVTSALEFDEDGLFYYGDKQGQVHVYDQVLDPAQGAQSLTIQGVQFGAVKQIVPVVLDGVRKLVVVQDSVPRKSEIVVFNRAAGTFELEAKLEVNQSWDSIQMEGREVMVTHPAQRGIFADKDQSSSPLVEILDLSDMPKEASGAERGHLADSGPSIGGVSTQNPTSLFIQWKHELGQILAFSHIQSKSSIICCDSNGFLTELAVNQSMDLQNISQQVKVPEVPRNLSSVQCQMDYNESTSQACLAFGAQALYIVGTGRSQGEHQIIKTTEDRKLCINFIKFSADQTRLAVCLGPQVPFTAPYDLSPEGAIVQIYRITAGGQSYECADTVHFATSAQADLARSWRVTSLDWSKDGSLMRMTFDDFRKVHISKSDDDAADAYQEDEEVLSKLVEAKQELASVWASETCLLRWETLGVFSPDPTRVSCVQKLTTQEGRHYAVTGLRASTGSSTILKLHDWPCLSPRQPAAAEISLAPGLHVLNMSIVQANDTFIICLVEHQETQQKNLVIYKFQENDMI